MDFELFQGIINQKLIEINDRPLNPTETLVLQGIWRHETYLQIAQQEGYSPGYLTNVVAPDLLMRLSALVDQKLTKKNCRKLLEAYLVTATQTKQEPIKQESGIDISTQEFKASYPSGAVPLGSPFYIKRSPLEEKVNAEISKGGALVRIKAPQEMGKTSMLLRVLHYAQQQGYHTVNLDCQQIDSCILKDLNLFLRWLCANITRQLKLKSKLNDYWDEDLGSKVSCSLYLESYLLPQLEAPLVIAFDEVNQIFEYPHIAKDFFPLLRSWYEEAKRQSLWQKLRWIIVHSTDIYVPLQLHQSPFNVGLPLTLEGFKVEQIEQLAQAYGLDWQEQEEAEKLMTIVGGHPALIHLALYYLSQGEMNLAQILETASSATGIYAHHLQRHCAIFQEQPELAQAFSKMIQESQKIQLEPFLIYKLSSMGLIKQFGDQIIPSCDLYRLWQLRQGFSNDEV
jgi:hypothetical protein